MPGWYDCWPDIKDQDRFDRAIEMTDSLHASKGNPINVYINDPYNLWGITNFPWSEEYLTPADNIIIAYASLPGFYSTDNVKMEGKTLIHEMGHFL